MLGQPISMLIPQVVGFRLTGELPSGHHRHRPGAHDHRAAAQARRGRQVRRVPRRRRRPRSRWPTGPRSATCRPEFGSTCAIFPIDAARRWSTCTLTGRPAQQLDLVEKYAKEQGLWHDPSRGAAVLRGAHPRPVHRRAVASRAPSARRTGSSWPTPRPPSATRCPATSGADGNGCASRPPTRSSRRRTPGPTHEVKVTLEDGTETTLDHGHVVIAAITSCTNTSNPLGDDRRRTAGQEGGRAGPEPQALGEDHPRARLQGRHGLLRARRAGALPRQARLQPGRLRLHHLHRQLRAAAARDQPGGQRQRPGRGRPCCPATGTSRAGSTRT